MVSISRAAPASLRIVRVASMISGPMPSPWATVMGTFLVIGGFISIGHSAASQPIEQQMQSVAHGPNRCAAQRAGALHKLCLIDREDLGYVHDARLRKLGLAFLQKHVARSVRPAQIRCNQANDAGCNRTPVENIV